MIVGFCGESEEDHAESMDLMRQTGFDQAFLFAYSKRDKTHAARHLQVFVSSWLSYNIPYNFEGIARIIFGEIILYKISK